jgi:hypothetical protein
MKANFAMQIPHRKGSEFRQFKQHSSTWKQILPCNFRIARLPHRSTPAEVRNCSLAPYRPVLRASFLLCEETLPWFPQPSTLPDVHTCSLAPYCSVLCESFFLCDHSPAAESNLLLNVPESHQRALRRALISETVRLSRESGRWNRPACGKFFHYI